MGEPMKFVFKARDGKTFAGFGLWGKLISERLRDRHDSASHDRDDDDHRPRRLMLCSTVDGWIVK